MDQLWSCKDIADIGWIIGSKALGTRSITRRIEVTTHFYRMRPYVVRPQPQQQAPTENNNTQPRTSTVSNQ